MKDTASSNGHNGHPLKSRHREMQELEQALLDLRSDLLARIDATLDQIARVNGGPSARREGQDGLGSERRSVLFADWNKP